MADDLLSVLNEFHREVVLPDIRKEISGVREDIRKEISGVREEMGILGEGIRLEIAKEISGVRGEINGLREDIHGEIDDLREDIAGLRREMLSHFDAIYARFDRLESEYQALAAAVARLEARSLTRAEFQHELEELKARVKNLEQRIVELEAES